MNTMPDVGLYSRMHESYQMYLAMILGVGIVLAVITLPVLRSGNGVRIPYRRNEILWITLLGAVLRLPLLFQDFWYDEAFTHLVVDGSWSRFWLVVAGDVHPPFYYALQKILFDVTGGALWALRLPAFAAGLGLIYVFYGIAHSYGRGIQRYIWMPFWTAVLVAVMPAAVYYSAEARYVSVLALLLSLSYLFILRERWWLAVLFAALSALVHVNAWFYAILLTYAVIHSARWRLSLATSIAIAVWVPFAFVQAGDVANGFWIMQSNPLRFIVDMTTTTRFFMSPLWLTLFVVGVWIALIGVSVWLWRKKASLLWLSLVTLPAVAQWLVGGVWHPIYLERTLLFSALLLVIPVAWWLSFKARPVLVLLMLVILMFANVELYMRDRTFADEALAACGGASVVYAPDTFSAVLADHYSDALIMVNRKHGNTLSQQLPDTTRETLWLVVNPEHLSPGTCFFIQEGALTDLGLWDHAKSITRDIEVKHIHDYYVGMVK